MKRVLCLWLPNWPVQRLRSHVPGIAPAPPEALDRQRPLLLWASDPRRGRWIAACCARAAARGVRVGMPEREAVAVLEGGAPREGRKGKAGSAAGGAAVVLPHDAEADREGLCRVAEIAAAELSPIVALEPLERRPWAGDPLHQPQSLLLDVTHLGPLFGGEEGLARAAAERMRALGLVARVAIAGATGAAWGLAHGLPAERLPCVVPPGDEAAWLSPLPIERLRLPAETARTLRRLGIERIGSLLRLPRDELARRLGSELLRRIDQALGTADEPLTTHRAPPAEEVAVELEHATTDRDIVGHHLEKALCPLAASLEARQRGALRLLLRLELVDRPAVELSLGLFAPSADAPHLLRLLATRFERVALAAPVRRLVLAADLTGPLGQHQASLLAAGDEGAAGSLQMGDAAQMGGPAQAGNTPSAAGSLPADARRDWARLIDALSGRLGRERVVGCRLTRDPLPERAVASFPLAGRPMAKRTTARRRRSGSSPARDRQRSLLEGDSAEFPGAGEREDRFGPSPEEPLRRPIRLLRTPLPLAVLALYPDGPPVRFRLGGRVCQIVRHWGPERIETGWWRGPSVRRDYFRVETEQGEWLWLFRRLPDGDWFLHGRF